VLLNLSSFEALVKPTSAELDPNQTRSQEDRRMALKSGKLRYQ